MGEKGGGTLRVTQTGSPIRRPKDRRRALVGLGLNRIDRSQVLEDTPSVRGMIDKVRHMVRLEEIRLGALRTAERETPYAFERMAT